MTFAYSFSAPTAAIIRVGREPLAWCWDRRSPLGATGDADETRTAARRSHAGRHLRAPGRGRSATVTGAIYNETGSHCKSPDISVRLEYADDATSVQSASATDMHNQGCRQLDDRRLDAILLYGRDDAQVGDWDDMSDTTDRKSRADLHGVIEARLQRTDQRYTNSRKAIVELLVTAGHPVSIADFAEKMPKLPRSTAYRNLVDLESAGIVRRIVAHDEFARFELSEDLTEHHHHLLCVACGKVIDFTLATRVETNVTKAIDELAVLEGFQPQSHRLDVLGICASCK